jgi:hypothetical protein
LPSRLSIAPVDEQAELVVEDVLLRAQLRAGVVERDARRARHEADELAPQPDALAVLEGGAARLRLLRERGDGAAARAHTARDLLERQTAILVELHVRATHRVLHVVERERKGARELERGLERQEEHAEAEVE